MQSHVITLIDTLIPKAQSLRVHTSRRAIQLVDTIPPATNRAALRYAYFRIVEITGWCADLEASYIDTFRRAIELEIVV